MNQDPQQKDSTLLVVSTIICVFSWMTEVVILFCHLFFGKLPGDNIFAHIVLIVLIASSSVYIYFVGRNELHHALRMGRPPNVTVAQSVLVTAILLTYIMTVVWALGL